MGTKTGKALLLEDGEQRSIVDVWAEEQRAQPAVAMGLAEHGGAAAQIQMNLRKWICYYFISLVKTYFVHWLNTASGARTSTSSFPSGGGGGGSSSSSVVNEERFIHAILAFKTGFVCSVGGSGGSGVGGGGAVNLHGGTGSVGRVAVLKLDKSLKETKPDEEIRFRGIL